MAYQLPILEVSHEAAESLASDQFRFVVLASDKVRRPDTALERAWGVVQNAPGSGEAATVMTDGITKVVAGAVLTAGMFVRPEYNDAADAGKAIQCASSDPNCAGVVIEAVAAEDELATIKLLPQYVGNTYGARRVTVTTEATAGDVTFTATQILGGLILRDPAGGARADLLPTAATIIAALGNPAVGEAFEFTVRNTADANETITITTNTGLTLSGTMTVAQNNSKRFLALVTAATTVTVYSLGTVVH